MENQKKTVIQWVKEHKKQLIAAGISITAIIVAIICLRNKDAIASALKALKEVVSKSQLTKSKVSTSAIETITHDVISKSDANVIINNSPELLIEVEKHLRKLPTGWKASPEKIAKAAEMWFELPPGCTWVDSYIKAA